MRVQFFLRQPGWNAGRGRGEIVTGGGIGEAFYLAVLSDDHDCDFAGCCAQEGGLARVGVAQVGNREPAGCCGVVVGKVAVLDEEVDRRLKAIDGVIAAVQKTHSADYAKVLHTLSHQLS